VLTETYLQYADHYFRVLNENRARFEEQRRQRDDYEDEGDGEDYEAEGGDTEAREERPDRDNGDRPEREDRGDRNGEYRAQRRPRSRRPEADEDEGQSERISLDVLPPAISAANEDVAEEEAKPARTRRPRRPRPADEDIAPAA
jgi:hypothetical protein